MSKMNNYSPIYQIDNGKKSGNNIYVKREDLLPFSLGGNKVRIAAEYFADMQMKGCDTMIAYGNARSNLCRVIANECCVRKIPCYIINSREEYETELADTSNSRIMKMLGAEIYPCRKDNIAETVESTIKKIQKNGGKPYYIFGNKFGRGNEAVAARAYAKAYEEISEFQRGNDLKFDFIFHASGTGATQSGLICGNILSGDNAKVIGILISSRDYNRAVSVITSSVKEYFRLEDIDIPHGLENMIQLEKKYTKGGYGLYDIEILDCIKKLYLESGLPLDPVYTGKAFWGMEQYLKENNIIDKNILFIHTGGTPLFFDSLNMGELV